MGSGDTPAGRGHTVEYDPFIQSHHFPTQLTFGPNMVRIWSRHPLNVEGKKPSYSTVRLAVKQARERGRTSRKRTGTMARRQHSRTKSTSVTDAMPPNFLPNLDTAPSVGRFYMKCFSI